MRSRAQQETIPVRTNFIIGAAALLASWACLWAASHSENWLTIAAAAVLFSFINNTLFSLHHEAVHGHLCSDDRLNDWTGRILAATFPTIFAIQRVSHLGHHRRNRSDEELYDSYLPHQSWLLKTYWIYLLLTGFYWSIIPVAGLIYVCCPLVFRARWFQNGPAALWGFKPFVKDIGRLPIGPVWRDGLVTLLFQMALFWALGLNFWGWLACYWAFGVNWSSVQYTDHAESPRHVTEGAWNLKFTRLSEMFFLNYNYHLVHHREPAIPWLHLPKHVRAGDPNPSFWRIYFRLWRGARPATAYLSEDVP